MLGRIFIFVILFSSLGVFIKLKRYGAPLSSILYSPGVAGAVLLASLIYGYKIINNEKVDDILPAVVLDIIKEKGLYREH